VTLPIRVRLTASYLAVLVIVLATSTITVPVGETAADFPNIHLNLGLTGTTYVMGSLLIIMLFFQFRSTKYVPGIYWLAVVLSRAIPGGRMGGQWLIRMIRASEGTPALLRTKSM
jgi:uncharacterized membrane-anchored protein